MYKNTQEDSMIKIEITGNDGIEVSRQLIQMITGLQSPKPEFIRCEDNIGPDGNYSGPSITPTATKRKRKVTENRDVEKDFENVEKLQNGKKDNETTCSEENPEVQEVNEQSEKQPEEIPTNVTEDREIRESTSETKVTLSEIVELAKEKATLVGREKVKNLISTFGVSKISEIPEDKFPEFKEGLETL